MQSGQVPAGVAALIVAPTRELAVQIAKDADAIFAPHRLTVGVLLGGVPRRHDQLQLRRKRPTVVVMEDRAAWT